MLVTCPTLRTVSTVETDTNGTNGDPQPEILKRQTQKVKLLKAVPSLYCNIVLEVAAPLNRCSEILTAWHLNIPFVITLVSLTLRDAVLTLVNYIFFFSSSKTR